ncbi:MAG: hypothetical protein GY940_17100, partial [bacterium]|nr:hypothetical protein [bacterium]
SYIEIKELQRVAIHLGQASGGYSGYLKVGNRLRRLPVGSTLDVKDSVFYWQPGPGFIGGYEFVFIRNEARQLIRKSITISIRHCN